MATASKKVNLVFHNEEGLETEIAPLTDYKDEQSFLSFDGGRIKVRMDSDACDVAAAETEGVRRLSQATSSTARPGPETKDIQAKFRRAYTSAHMALRGGRRYESSIEVEVTTDGSVNVDIGGLVSSLCVVCKMSMPNLIVPTFV